jgi:uncharacterized membrane protein
LLIVALTWGRFGVAQQYVQTLHHHLRPAVASGKAEVVGTLPPDQQLNFSIVLPLRNQTELAALLERLYDPASVDYRHFLSVAQFTAAFGPSSDDYQSVVSFARANGFTVTGTPANRLVVPLRGSVDQINNAFHVTMTQYKHPVGERNQDHNFYSPDREPSLDLAVPVAHISGLDNDSNPTPMWKRADRDLKQGVHAANVLGSGPQQSYLASDMRAAYYGGTTLDGNGQSVGLLEFGGYYLSDVDATFSTAGQSYNVPVNNVLLNGASAEPEENEDDGEQVLDIVQAIGMAPGLSQVRVYIGAGNDDANVLNSMASENIAKSLSSSWSWLPEDPTTDDVFFKEFAAQGQSFFVASGDEGAYDAAIDPYFYPAEDDYVTAVGGTHLTTDGPGGSWNSEVAWNTPYVGSGGGISPDGIAIPAWQSGIATFLNGGSTTLRNVPDVAMEADLDNYSCDLGYCDPGYGGTSFAAPRWAAFIALVNQQAVEAGTAPSGGIGFFNPSLYTIGKGTSYSEDLHDIISGNNDTEGQPVYYFAVPGYDLVTGWGSANGQSLIDNLAGKQVPGFWIEASSTNISLLPGQSATTSVTVTDAAGFSGNVTLAITSALPKGVTASWSKNPTSGTSVLTILASATAPSATSTLTISGTSGKLTAVSHFTLQIQGPTFALSSTPNSLLLNPGSTVTSTIALSPENGFTGSVQLSASGLPAGVTASFSPASTSGTSTLTLKASASAVHGQTGFTITGTSGSLVVSTQIPLVVAAPSIEFSGPSTLSIGQNSLFNTYFDAYGENGLTGNIQLSISGLPAGVTALFSPIVLTAQNDQTILTLISSSSTPFGTKNLTITGTSGSVTATTTLALSVDPPAFAIYGPVQAALGQGTTSTFPLYVYQEYGLTGSVQLAVSGLPPGVTASISPNPASGQTELTLSAASTVLLGQSKVTITGTSGKVTASTSFLLGILTPTFVVASPGSVAMGQGAATSVPISVTPEYGFSGSVNLSVAGLPKGVTAYVLPNPTTGNTSLSLVSSSSATPGTAQVTVTGTSGKQTSTSAFSLSINAPSFTVSSPGPVTLGQGTTVSSPIPITELYGFLGAINLSIAGLPSGVTASFSPNPATGSTVLTLSATASAPVGKSVVTITGTSGTLTSTATFPLSIAAPGFSIQNPGSLTIGPGTTTTVNVPVIPENGFAGPVNLSIAGLPTGVSASFAPNPANPTITSAQNVTLTLTSGSSVTFGTTVLTITGTSGKVTSTTTFALTVSPASITISGPQNLSLGQGTTSSSTLSIYGQHGFSGNVALSVSGLPSGVTASLSPNPVTMASSSSGLNSTLTLTASSSAAAGTSTVTVTATSGKLSSTTSFPLTVYAPSFTVSGPGGVGIGQGTSSTTTISVNENYGFTSPVNLTVSGLPTGVSGSFSPNPATGNSQLMLTAGDSAALGTSVVTITGTSGKITSLATFVLTVGSTAFTLSGPGSVNIGQGSSATAYFDVNPLYGFTGNATLSVSGLPSGVTASFSPNPSNGSTQLALTASSASPLGTHILTVTASYGKLTQTVVFPLVTYAQSFTLSNEGNVTVGTGSSITTSISVNPQYGFTGSVNLTAAGLPAGVTASFSPNPTNGLAILTLTASSTAPLAYSEVVVTGTYGNQSASTAFLVGTVAPGFAVSIQGPISLGQGNSTTANVTISPQNGFSGGVTLSASNLPAGVSASFSPDLVTGQSMMTITAGSTAAVGSDTLIVTGTSTGASGKLTATTAVGVMVYQPTFQIQSPGATTIGQGSSSPIYVSINSEYGFAGEVNLGLSGLPSGVTASFLPNPVTSSSTATLTASSSAAPGTYTVTVTGTSGKRTQTATFPLTIAAPSFSLNNYCGGVNVVIGSSTTCYLYLNQLNGFEGSVNLAIAGLPSGVTASFSPNPTATQTMLTLTASSTAPLTTANTIITGTSGTQTSTSPLAVTVTAPTFSIYSGGGSLSIAPGSSGSTSVYAYGVNGFSGNVNLSISGLPSGVSATFSPSSVALGTPALLTISATAKAAAGTSTLTITGSSGGQKVTSPLTLTIAAPSFSIAPPGELLVGVGDTSTNNYPFVQGNPGFSGNVQLAISGLPAGVSASFSPNPTSYLSDLTLQATNSAVPGEYNVTITGKSGALTASATTTLTVAVPSFAIIADSTINVGRGTSATAYYLYIEPQDGFSGNVQLAMTGLPSGVTASFSPNPANPSNNQTVLTLTASSTAALGQYTATITGTAGKQIVSTPVSVGVYTPTFTLGQQSGSISPGASTTFFVFINSEYGFSSAVNLAVSGLPSGVTGSFSPNPVQNGSSNLTLQASSSAPAGQYNFTVTGTSGSQKVSAIFSLTVNTSTFSLYPPYFSAIGQGSSATGYIGVDPFQFSGSVRLSISGLPAGVTASFTPNPASNGSSTLTLQASSTAALGQYNVTVTGVSGNQTASTTFPITIYVPTFTVYTPQNVILGQGTTTTATAQINQEYGFAGNVSLALSGLPKGVTGSFAPNPTTQQSTLTLTAATTAPLGQYNALLTGTSGKQSSSAYFPISIYAPTFTLAGPYYGVTVSQGTVSTTQVTINPEYGFTGKVSFAVSGLPAGLTASFSPNPTTQTTNLTLTAGKTVALGTYNLTVTGTSGSQSSTTTLPVTVNAGTFSIDVPQGATLGVGSTTTVYAGYTTTNGFQGSVSFTATGLPKGVTASIGPNSTPQYSYIVLTASSTAVVGNYTFTITGTSGSLSSSTSVPLAIVTPTFTLLDIDQYYGDPIDLNPGSTYQTKIVIDPQNGFTGSVTFAATTLPKGVTASFSPNPGTQNTIMTLTASSTAPGGTQNVTVSGTSGSQSASTTFPIQILQPTFSLTGYSGTSLSQGSTAAAEFFVNSEYGFDGEVTFTVSSLPKGVTASFSPNPTTQQTTLTLSATSATVIGTYPLSVTGKSGSETSSVGFYLVIAAPTTTVQPSVRP